MRFTPRMMRFLLFLYCLLGSLAALTAQDSHFTQFYGSPLTLNPALTGAFEGRYRVGTVYRDQWRKVLDYPMRTFSLGGDLRLRPPFKKIKRDAVGLGLLFVNDRVGVVEFNTTQIAVSLAYHKALGTDETQFLTLGFQGGLTQRTINYDALRFQDEFDGFAGFNLGTGEIFPPNNFSYGDYSTGINYTARFGRTGALFLGLALHHFNQPRIVFGPEVATGQDQLFTKSSLQAAANLPIPRSRVSIHPRFLLANQGPYMQLNMGSNVRFALGQYGGSAFQLGGWMRPVRNLDGIGVDALVALAGIEMNNILVGLSYDINVRALNARQRQGAFEISVMYLGSYDNEEIICPKF